MPEQQDASHGRLRIQTLTLAHAGVLAVFLPWAFGGQADWVRAVVTAWGLAGVLLLAAGCVNVRRIGIAIEWKPLLCLLLPLLGYAALQVIALFNASHLRVVWDGNPVFIPRESITWLPSSARPDLGGRELALHAAIFVTTLNALLWFRNRHAWRVLVGIFAVNATMIAVVGSFQALLRAGFYFGMAESPNARFFGTFVYQNHWAAFSVLAVAAGLGLATRHFRQEFSRGFTHSPGFAWMIGAMLLILSLPLAASRSGTVLAVLLITVFLAYHAAVDGKRSFSVSPVKLLLVGGVLLVIGSFSWVIGREIIENRLLDTTEQVREIRETGVTSGRAALYGDTIRLWKDRPWFGWGLETYGTVFPSYNTQVSVEGWTINYREAHSDWLQSLAETGTIGTLLLATALVLPLFACTTAFSLRRSNGWWLLGAGLILVYALVEFPFANPAVIFGFLLLHFGALSATAGGKNGRKASTGAPSEVKGALGKIEGKPWVGMSRRLIRS